MKSRATDGRRTLETNLDLVERALRWTSRRHRLAPEDAEELRSIVFLKLIEDDYAVLRKFRGESRLGTYLTTVVQRQALDYLNAKWGKWRPSRAARRMGDVALRLETLIARDGRTPDEAIETLRAEARPAPSRAKLERIVSRLPARRPRRLEPLDAAGRLASDERTDAAVERQEDARLLGRARARLADLLATLPDEDRRILELRYEEGLKVSQIAARLELEQRPLYRRIERCLGALRRDLEAEGVTRRLVAEASPGL